LIVNKLLSLSVNSSLSQDQKDRRCERVRGVSGERG
jgi:hypothetical protein